MTKGKPIRRLVFWYGTPEYEFHEAFSFVPVSKICSYEAGVKKGYDIIPVRIQNVSARGINSIDLTLKMSILIEFLKINGSEAEK